MARRLEILRRHSIGSLKMWSEARGAPVDGFFSAQVELDFLQDRATRAPWVSKNRKAEDCPPPAVDSQGCRALPLIGPRCRRRLSVRQLRRAGSRIRIARPAPSPMNSACRSALPLKRSGDLDDWLSWILRGREPHERGSWTGRALVEVVDEGWTIG